MTPADILFIGDSPDAASDTVGKPFSGDVGKCLDLIIQKAGTEPLTVAFTNLLACHPSNDQGQREPKKSELLSCFPRVIEFIKITKPSLIVTLGVTTTKIIKNWADDLTIDDYTPIKIEISHPAYIYRTGGMDSVAFSYAVVALRTQVQFLKRCKGW